MQALLEEHLAATLQSRVKRSASIAGGDINEAYRVELEDGRTLFVKTNARAPAGLFAAEARGLTWLRQANTLKVPEVIAVGEKCDGAFLALEYLAAGRPASDHDERLGRGLADLHRCRPAHFGFDEDNFIGSLPQPNAPLPSWSTFYRERRLEPLVERARGAGLCPTRTSQRFEKLFERLEGLVGPEEPPARLHGDLWSGNRYTTASGEPALIDPAVYGGHREVDLAMMKLFGGFSNRVFQAYDEAYPLSSGHQERVALYQLYPLLVHVNLFGTGYLGQLEQALSRYV